MDEFDGFEDTLALMPDELDEKPLQLWKTSDMKAQKEGPRRTIYSSVKSVGRPKDEYTGQWNDNKKEGMGTQAYKNEDKYVGLWQNGKRHGQGEYFKKVDDQLVKRYSGEWVDGFRHGRGMLFGDDAELYDGEWERGKRHGEGKQFYLNGDTYEGQWANHVRQGFGRLTVANGDVFEGHFLDDRKEGSGTYFYVAKKKRLDGEWAADTSKCGVMTDFSLDVEGKDGTLPATWGKEPSKRMPQLGLRDGRGVLGSCLARVRQERSAIRLQKTPVEDIFTADDLEQLTKCFRAIDVDNRGAISVDNMRQSFVELGLELADSQVEGALLALEIDGLESFAVSMDNYCRVIALSMEE